MLALALFSALLASSRFAMAQTTTAPPAPAASNNFLAGLISGGVSLLTSIDPALATLSTLTIPTTLVVDGSTFNLPVIANAPTSTSSSASSTSSSTSATTTSSPSSSAASTSSSPTVAGAANTAGSDQQPSPTATPQKSSSSNKLPIILGAVLGALALLLLALILLCCLRRRKRRAGKSVTDSEIESWRRGKPAWRSRNKHAAGSTGLSEKDHVLADERGHLQHSDSDDTTAVNSNSTLTPPLASAGHNHNGHHAAPIAAGVAGAAILGNHHGKNHASNGAHGTTTRSGHHQGSHTGPPAAGAAGGALAGRNQGPGHVGPETDRTGTTNLAPGHNRQSHHGAGVGAGLAGATLANKHHQNHGDRAGGLTDSAHHNHHGAPVGAGVAGAGLAGAALAKNHHHGAQMAQGSSNLRHDKDHHHSNPNAPIGAAAAGSPALLHNNHEGNHITSGPSSGGILSNSRQQSRDRGMHAGTVMNGSPSTHDHHSGNHHAGPIAAGLGGAAAGAAIAHKHHNHENKTAGIAGHHHDSDKSDTSDSGTHKNYHTPAESPDEVPADMEVADATANDGPWGRARRASQGNRPVVDDRRHSTASQLSNHRLSQGDGHSGAIAAGGLAAAGGVAAAEARKRSRSRPREHSESRRFSQGVIADARRRSQSRTPTDSRRRSGIPVDEAQRFSPSRTHDRPIDPVPDPYAQTRGPGPRTPTPTSSATSSAVGSSVSAGPLSSNPARQDRGRDTTERRVSIARKPVPGPIRTSGLNDNRLSTGTSNPFASPEDDSAPVVPARSPQRAANSPQRVHKLTEPELNQFDFGLRRGHSHRNSMDGMVGGTPRFAGPAAQEQHKRTGSAPGVRREWSFEGNPPP